MTQREKEKMIARVIVSGFIAVTAGLLFSWHPAVGFGYAVYFLIMPEARKEAK